MNLFRRKSQPVNAHLSVTPSPLISASLPVQSDTLKSKRIVPPVQTSWLAWPTLMSGAGLIKVAGVYYHQDELHQVLRTYGPLVMAELTVESSGQYAGAVHVSVARTLLGNIPHDLAEKYREMVLHLHSQGKPATCRAQLEANEYFDVWLDAKPEERVGETAFLPRLGEVDVVLDEGQAERIDASLKSKAKTKRLEKLGGLLRTEDGWRVLLDHELIGTLKQNDQPYLYQADSRSLPMTCMVRILRRPDRPLFVGAEFPTGDIIG